MRERWIGKKVRLELLCEKIKCFFEDYGFQVSTITSNGKFEVFGVGEKVGGIKVTIRGEPDDFIVEFVSPFEGDLLMKFSTLATMMGFGFLIKNRADSFDLYKKLEERFWSFLAKTISQLSKAEGV